MPRERFTRKFSPFVEERVPDFVRNDYLTYVTFLKAYFEWMEVEGNPIERTASLLQFRDVDETPPEFLSFLETEYLNSLPQTLAAEKRLVIKLIQEYHKAKGTPQAFIFLFRILYAIDVTIDFPWKHVVKLSAATYQLDTTLKLTTLFGAGEWNKAIGHKITQANNNTASATIDAVRQRYDAGKLITEIYLHDIQGKFTSSERCTASFVENDITKSVYGVPLYNVVTALNIVASGIGYAVGDQMIFTPECSGVGARGHVSAVTKDGAILEVKLNEFGYNYQTTPTVSVQSSSGGSGASINASIGVTGTYPGYYLDGDGGFISNGQVIQDSEYYQRFSYVIEKNVTDGIFVKDYKQTIKASAHPAGMKMFGRLVINSAVDSGTESFESSYDSSTIDVPTPTPPPIPAGT